MSYSTIQLIDKGAWKELRLNRPDKRNSLNKEMIAELTAVFGQLSSQTEPGVLSLVGNGQSFCAGADIKWLNTISESSEEEIKKEFVGLAKMLEALHCLPQITIAMVHGPVYGGGIGLMAACDYVVCEPKTEFSFSEIKLGLIPATISPYVYKRVGASEMKKLFLTGDKFNEVYAREIGLIEDVKVSEKAGECLHPMIEKLIKQPPHALAAMKKLCHALEEGKVGVGKQHYSSGLIAKLIKEPKTQQLFDRFLRR